MNESLLICFFMLSFYISVESFWRVSFLHSCITIMFCYCIPFIFPSSSLLLYRQLATASVVDSQVVIWDIATASPTPLKQLGIGGFSLLRWSPNGHYLFSATT